MNLIIDKFSILSYNDLCYAVVAELADALDSGSSARKGMEVQVLSAAPVTARLSAFYQYTLVSSLQQLYNNGILIVQDKPTVNGLSCTISLVIVYKKTRSFICYLVFLR